MENTVIGIRRNIKFYKQVAMETGVNIVSGTGENTYRYIWQGQLLPSEVRIWCCHLSSHLLAISRGVTLDENNNRNWIAKYMQMCWLLKSNDNELAGEKN